MKKFFLAPAVFLLLALGMNAGAQELLFSKSDLGNLPQRSVSKKILKSKITLAEDESWVGYWDGVSGDLSQSVGVQDVPMNYGAAVKFPAGDPQILDKQIAGITFTFPDATYITSVRVWIAESENGLPGNKIYMQSVPEVTGLNNAEDPMNEIRLETPYTVDPAKEIFVGYSFIVADGNSTAEKYPVTMLTGIDSNPNSIFLEFSGFGWSNYSDAGFGPLAIRVLVKGDVQDNHVSVNPEGREICVVKGMPVEIPVKLINTGTGFKSVDGYIEIEGGKTPFSITAEQEITGNSAEYEFTQEVPAMENLGIFEYKIVVEKVNGVANNSTVNTSVGTLKIMNEIPVHKVIFEDLTGFWCGWCPRGYVAVEKLVQTFGEAVIPVMVHIEDVLEYPDYKPLDKGQFPNALIDRTYSGDPYYDIKNINFGVRTEFEKILNTVPMAGIVADPTLEDGILEAVANVKFALPVANAQYAVGFIVTEDGMTDPGWEQANNYPDFQHQGLEIEEPLFEPWVNGSRNRKDVIQNYVPVAGTGIIKGLDGSIPANVEEGVVYSVSRNLELSNYSLIQNRDNLSLIAILIDTATGQIINADKKKVYDTTGVEESVIDENAVEIARYTVDGRIVSQPVPGINIVRYSDGRVEKVFVRE